jgi:ribosomal protein L37E
MVPQPTITCSRCGRHNPSRARFCAQCGLNLSARGGGDQVTRALRKNGRKGGTGLILFILLLGLFLAAMGSLFHSRPCSVHPVRPHHRFTSPCSPYEHEWPIHPRLDQRGVEKTQQRPHVQWHAEWAVAQ